jgi:hypothetical protein
VGQIYHSNNLSSSSRFDLPNLHRLILIPRSQEIPRHLFVIGRLASQKLLPLRIITINPIITNNNNNNLNLPKTIKCINLSSSTITSSSSSGSSSSISILSNSLLSLQ